MPIIKSAQKAARQAVKHTAHNRDIKKQIKAALKAFKADPSAATLSKAQSEYDKAAKKGLLKPNTVSRRKAALSKIAKENGVKLATKSAAKPAAKATTAKKAAAKKPAAKKTTATKATTKKTPAKKTTKKA